MPSMFSAATRGKRPLRLALDGPTGSGKTYTALRFAHALQEWLRERGRPHEIAVLDTEKHSASLYVGIKPDGTPWNWQSVCLEHYAPSAYTAVIREAARCGFAILVIDSLSHAWMGVGGALDQVDRAASRSSGGSWGAWREVTPSHNEMVDAICGYPGHVIVTLRAKMETVLEEDERGKKEVKKLGMKSIQRDGLEYEFDLVADLDVDHRIKVSKTRYECLDGRMAVKPGPEFLAPVLDWLDDSGAPPPVVAAPQQPEANARAEPRNGGSMTLRMPAGELAGEVIAKQIVSLWGQLEQPVDKLQSFLAGKQVARVSELPIATAQQLLRRLEGMEMHRQAAEVF